MSSNSSRQLPDEVRKLLAAVISQDSDSSGVGKVGLSFSIDEETKLITLDFLQPLLWFAPELGQAGALAGAIRGLAFRHGDPGRATASINAQVYADTGKVMIKFPFAVERVEGERAMFVEFAERIERVVRVIRKNRIAALNN